MGAPDGGPAPYYMVAEYYFESMDDLQEAFTSEAGQRLRMRTCLTSRGKASVSSSRRSPVQKAGLSTQVPREIV